jgi:hypothetical protein
MFLKSVCYREVSVKGPRLSRSATEEEDPENFSNHLWLFRTWMPMLRRQDLL